jgi:alpha-galactosidase/6-phospho-beta-glucosidase family protein
MAPRIVIIGGGSYQWAPKLLIDVANTPSLHDAEIVLADIDPQPLPQMVQLVERIAKLRSIGLRARGTTNQQDALEGADFVVVTISTGGFASMRHDLEVPERYGIRQSVGDSVGPGGINRALRNIPVLMGIARDMEELCPDAWLLNITNPMTTLCRAVTRSTSIKTVGLCHEIAMTRYTLSNLLGARYADVDLTITGVNHLPIITAVRINGDDGFEALRDLVEHADERAGEMLHIDFPDDLDESLRALLTKGSVLESNRLKFELFRRFGALPGAGDRHLAEFFPGFLTEASGWGEQWGVKLTTIADREADRESDIGHFEELLAMDEVPTTPSGEIVAPLIDSFLTGTRREFPVNMPNTGQCPDFPPDVVVESIGVAEAEGIRGRDRASAPPVLAEYLRRVSASQELTVDAALSGSRERVFEAMLADPLAGRIDFDVLARMSDEMIDATKPWLPQFA